MPYDDEEMRNNLEKLIGQIVFQDFLAICSTDLAEDADDDDKKIIVDVETNEVKIVGKDEKIDGIKAIILYEFPDKDTIYSELIDSYEEFEKFRHTMINRIDKKTLLQRSKAGEKALEKLEDTIAEEPEDDEDEDEEDSLHILEKMERDKKNES